MNRHHSNLRSRVAGAAGPGRSTTSRTATIAAVLLLLLSGGPLSAQDPLAYRDRGNRFEGHWRSEVSAPSLEPLSFTRGGPLATLSAPTTLRASFFLPRPASVHIEATELVPVKLYRMTWKRTEWPEGAGSIGPWETAAVIDLLGVSLANVGVLARVGSTRVGSGGELAALSFSGSGANSSAYEFVFRVKYDVRSATYSVEQVASGTAVASGSYSQLAGGAPVSIQFDLAGAPEGRYRLLIDCLYDGRRGGPQRTYEFHHRPSRD